MQGKKSFIQEGRGRQGGPRMEGIEKQGPKVQFLHCLIKSRTWSWKHTKSHVNPIIWDTFWWGISSSTRQTICPWFQVGKSYRNTLKKCPVRKSPFFPVCRVVWKVLYGQNAWITTDDRLALWVYTAYMNVISESARQGLFSKTDNTERKLKWKKFS